MSTEKPKLDSEIESLESEIQEMYMNTNKIDELITSISKDREVLRERMEILSKSRPDSTELKCKERTLLDLKFKKYLEGLKVGEEVFAHLLYYYSPRTKEINYNIVERVWFPVYDYSNCKTHDAVIELKVLKKLKSGEVVFSSLLYGNFISTSKGETKQLIRFKD